MTELQERTIKWMSSGQQGTTIEQAQKAMAGFLFTDAIESLNNGVVLTLTEDDDDVTVPWVFTTFEEAKAEYLESKTDWEEFHDEDDPYEGCVIAMKWNDDDTVNIYGVDDNGNVITDAFDTKHISELLG